MEKFKNNLIPLLMSVGVVVGILIGSFFSSHYSGRKLSIINTSSNKINDLFHLIDDEYVDSVNIPDLVEKSLPQILRQLDPHSVYISAKDVEGTMQDLNGSFSGIGVQFTIYQDTVRIIRIIKGGPSESVGLHAGDRIIRVDDKPYVGSIVSNEETLTRLKGPKGSRVKVDVLRAGSPQPLSFDIIRGDVPVKSITAAYMVSDSTGYIRINTFGETTYPEFLAALASLGQQGFSNLILDLRGNLGGYMEPAVQIASEFLSRNRLIVYTQGRKSPRKQYRSDGRGTYQQLPLVVLVDETSASATEILTGAIQDNDRGTVVGRRTFGKGLVQVPIQFEDGSMLRLTTSRYYTPSGRCVQKPYMPGEEDDYEADLMLRAIHGEYQNADSIKTTGEQYKTSIGRIVYGGGGITPDIFIPEDTANLTSYFKEAYARGLIFQFSYVFADKHRARLEKCRDADEMAKYLQQQDLLGSFATFAENTAGLRRRNLLLQRSAPLFRQHIISNILDDILDTQAALSFINQTDPAVQAALGILRTHTAFPKAPGTDVRKVAALLPVTAPVCPMADVWGSALGEYWCGLQQWHRYGQALFFAPLARISFLALGDKDAAGPLPVA